ncbi:MAG: NUDIX domain-containing protein [Bacteroidetes bacterium]|nr:NUDIX domain-containing protein [Bacteroidota bacterium]
MYKVFINDMPIILTDKVIKDDNFELFLLDEVDPQYLIERVNKGNLKMAYLFHKDEKKLIKNFKKKIKTVVAAGGVVRNSKGEILFIYRNGKWDLPKGRKERSETKEAAAIRETTEETGVNNLKIVRPLDKTYHVFKRNGVYRLKVTHWFEMQTNFEGKTRPELTEGIEKAVWFSLDQAKEILPLAYANIRHLLENAQILTEVGTNKV